MSVSVCAPELCTIGSVSDSVLLIAPSPALVVPWVALNF
jgi:hypothetical protein